MKKRAVLAIAGIVGVLSAPLSTAQELTQTTVAQSAFGSLFSAGRNYVLGVSTTAKVGLLLTLLFIAIIIFIRMKDSPSNNLRKAREMHDRAVKLHSEGKDEEAQASYSKADSYREKAQEQSL
jgi:hypothetical protein